MHDCQTHDFRGSHRCWNCNMRYVDYQQAVVDRADAAAQAPVDPYGLAGLRGATSALLSQIGVPAGSGAPASPAPAPAWKFPDYQYEVYRKIAAEFAVGRTEWEAMMTEANQTTNTASNITIKSISTQGEFYSPSPFYSPHPLNNLDDR